MPFLKIKDLAKREQMVKEYLATKKRIRDSQLAEKTGEIELQTGLSKFFKPITETQKEAATKITEELKPIKEGIEQLPQRLPQQQLIPKEEEEEEEIRYTLLDEKYRNLKEEYEGNIDTTFGIKRKGINYFIGDKMVDYDGDYIWVGAEKFPATDSLWELIMAKEPSKKHNFLPNDLKNYEKILEISNVIFHDNNPKNRPKSSGGKKYNVFISEIYYEIKEKKDKQRRAEEEREKQKKKSEKRETTGDGITIIPSDPNALLERLDHLMASKKAGNTGVRNELVSICDELKRQHVLNSKSYKKLMSILKK